MRNAADDAARRDSVTRSNFTPVFRYVQGRLSHRGEVIQIRDTLLQSLTTLSCLRLFLHKIYGGPAGGPHQARKVMNASGVTLIKIERMKLNTNSLFGYKSAGSTVDIR